MPDLSFTLTDGDGRSVVYPRPPKRVRYRADRVGNMALLWLAPDDATRDTIVAWSEASTPLALRFVTEDGERRFVGATVDLMQDRGDVVGLLTVPPQPSPEP